MDSLEQDIKQFLITCPNMKAQWKEIRNAIFPHYKRDYKTRSSFGVTLDRELKRLLGLDDIDKEVAGHRSVFYFIPKKHGEEIIKQLLRANINKSFEEYWEANTPEQKKGIVQSLIKYGSLSNLVLQKFIGNLTKELDGLISMNISELEKPSEIIKKKYSPTQRKEFLEELNSLKAELKKINSQTKPVQKQDLGKEFKIRMELAQEFQKVVVEPNYEGNWDSAIIDLMEKAIEEQKGKDKQ